MSWVRERVHALDVWSPLPWVSSWASFKKYKVTQEKSRQDKNVTGSDKKILLCNPKMQTELKIYVGSHKTQKIKSATESLYLRSYLTMKKEGQVNENFKLWFIVFTMDQSEPSISFNLAHLFCLTTLYSIYLSFHLIDGKTKTSTS